MGWLHCNWLHGNPESTQEVDQILGSFWFVYITESPQDLKRGVNMPEFTQKVTRSSIKFWALSGLFTLPWKPGNFLLCKQTRKGPEFD